MVMEITLHSKFLTGWGIEMKDDKDKEAKERMKAWKALPEEGRISWEGFKRQWQQRKASK